MIRLNVMYPEQEGKKFDLDYYLGKHMPMVRSKWSGLVKDVNVARGVSGGAADAPPTYRIVAQLSFESMDDLKKAVDSGGELFADIPNFTDIRPVVQVSEVLG